MPLKYAKGWYRMWIFYCHLYSFAVSLPVFEKKYYLKLYLDNCAYEKCKQTTDRLCWWKFFWRLDIINAVLQ